MKTSRIRNSIRRQVAEKLRPKCHSWVGVATAVLSLEGKSDPGSMTKRVARNIVLSFARGKGYSVPADEPSKRKPRQPRVKRTSYKKVSDAFFASDRWRELRYLAIKNCGAKCLCCGATPADGIVLHVDHIKPRYHYPELQWELSNLQVLCADCNYGKRAWDETDWRTDPMREHMKSIKQE